MPLEKAYDTAALIEALKTEGIDVVEESAKKLINAVFGWVEESVKLSATPFDDVALAVLPPLKKAALEKIDLLDGKVG